MGGLDLLGSGGSSLRSSEAGTGLRLMYPPGGQSGRAWPGLQGSSGQAQEVGVELASHGAGTGSAGS